MSMQVTDEQREQDLYDFAEILKASKELLVALAKRGTQHAEQVIVSNSEIDEQIGSHYIEASNHIKAALAELKPIGDKVLELQAEPEPISFLRRFIRWVCRIQPKERPQLT